MLFTFLLAIHVLTLLDELSQTAECRVDVLLYSHVDNVAVDWTSAYFRAVVVCGDASLFLDLHI